VSHQLQDTAEAIEQGIGAFDPENANDLGDFLKSLPDIHEAEASAYSRQADQLSEGQPVHPAVIEHLRELASQADGLREYAAETYHIWATAHEAELQRLENPRPNESLWDVVENQ
jgi:hypothetical protein